VGQSSTLANCWNSICFLWLVYHRNMNSQAWRGYLILIRETFDIPAQHWIAEFELSAEGTYFIAIASHHDDARIIITWVYIINRY
jgi:hypothetical protein